ncbi:uncharacterized protein LOC115631930 [Scaptodrosophila lebanonensis]|uniref:Uncharacterized protein LOC115631930 n=1 Tax=Drosophila lebanonensis TaxID=7225 RepID=A0A6J2U810_DROLE|nr:uncharacterized protein LOC115631930 [Scaptodrosophila lebanonensis]
MVLGEHLSCPMCSAETDCKTLDFVTCTHSKAEETVQFMENYYEIGVNLTQSGIFKCITILIEILDWIDEWRGCVYADLNACKLNKKEDMSWENIICETYQVIESDTDGQPATLTWNFYIIPLLFGAQEIIG